MASITILQYEGILTQEIITNNMDIIEQGVDNMGMMGKIATVAIELSQNMMTYSKSIDLDSDDIMPFGSIEITTADDIFYIKSKNIINSNDKNTIEPKLEEIKSLDASGIKKKYKELRKSGKQMHDNNGGIGFFEIAKQVTSFDYDFEPINDNKLYFTQSFSIQPKQK